MNKGGYQILDFKNKPMSSGVGMVFEGIYDKLEGTRKPILISGLHYGGIEYHDFFATFHVDGSDYIHAGDDINIFFSIRINSNDIVTIIDL